MVGDMSMSGIVRSVVVLAIFAVVLTFVLQGIASSSGVDNFGTYWNESEQWCESRGGDLYNAQALWHGGLHCEFDNGTEVHIDNVDVSEE